MEKQIDAGIDTRREALGSRAVNRLMESNPFKFSEQHEAEPNAQCNYQELFEILERILD